jgi:hypothetical protein
MNETTKTTIAVFFAACIGILVVIAFCIGTEWQRRIEQKSKCVITAPAVSEGQRYHMWCEPRFERIAEYGVQDGTT